MSLGAVQQKRYTSLPQGLQEFSQEYIEHSLFEENKAKKTEGAKRSSEKTMRDKGDCKGSWEGGSNRDSIVVRFELHDVPIILRQL